MADIPTFDDLFQAGKFEILRRPTRFNSAIVDTPGSDVNIVCGCGAAMADDSSRFAQQVFNEVHLSTSIRTGGEVLDRWVWDRYGLTRQEAQQAVATLSFARPSALTPVEIPAGTVVTTEDGQTFETVNSVVMGTGVIGPVSVTAFAQIAGQESKVEAGAINTIVSSLSDPNITVTNDEPAAGGGPEESDDNLGRRASDFFLNARRGTRRAIQNGCVTTPGVAQATVVEYLNTQSIPNFRVGAIISDENGQANSALAAAVLERQEEFRGLGVPVIVIAGVPQYVEIVVDGLTFEAGANTTTIIDQLRGQVASQVNQLRPGRTLEVSRIVSALRYQDLVNVPDGAVISPAGDLVPSSTSGVIRTTRSRITINGVSG